MLSVGQTYRFAAFVHFWSDGNKNGESRKDIQFTCFQGIGMSWWNFNSLALYASKEPLVTKDNVFYLSWLRPVLSGRKKIK